MTTKCIGLIGRIFGHKWVKAWGMIKGRDYVCQRCGAVTGEKK